ncbi:MAG: phosphate ABC transporter permease PstA [Planctomycetes bacterium]|nr:phosphate ABC transporter permease PstA [Planctomycetota bacterium]
MSARHAQTIAFALLALSTLLVVLPALFMVFFLVRNGLPALSAEFLLGEPKDGMRAGGIFPAIVGSFCLVVGAITVSVPIGVLTAIYLSEYSSDSAFTRLVRLAILNLAGVPSVVYGLFGMGLFVYFLGFGQSIMAGALTLSIMNLPVIITATREALQSVPPSFREVSLALGATRWQTVRYAVLPNAIPGILTGVILEVSRAAGETAPILFTVAAFYLPGLPQSVFDPVMALPYHLYSISTQVPNISAGMRYGTALTLVGLVLSVNVVAIFLRAHLRRKRRW